MRLASTLILLVIIVFACKSQKDAASQQSQESQALKMLMSDNYGGTVSEEIEVIRSQGTLDKYFIQINKTRKPGIKPPYVDFSKDLVIIYCSGETKRNQLPELFPTEDEKQRIVLTKKMVEAPDNQEGNALLMPFGLYIMPLTDKEIILQRDSSP